MSAFLIGVTIALSPSALFGSCLWAACWLTDRRRGGEPRG